MNKTLLSRLRKSYRGTASIFDYTVGRCSSCVQPVDCILYNNGKVKVQCNHSENCKLPASDIESFCLYHDRDEDQDIVKSIWPKIDWGQEVITVPKKSNVDLDLLLE